VNIRILGTESLGVRGLSCVVEAGSRKIVVDPGLALGYQRHGLLPHPAQVAVGERVRENILTELQVATDVVLSHIHGDHVPLADANPYQLNARRVAPLCKTVQLWAKGPKGLSDNMLRRKESLSDVLGRDLPNAEGQEDGPLSFSLAVPHGEPHSRLGAVMMTRVGSDGQVFVHASDIQLLNSRAVSLILDWQPDIVLVDGPPLYLKRFMDEKRRRRAWEQALRLAQGVNTVILDHHILRCEEGLDWLDRLSAETGHQVICAADFMKTTRCLLEAQREELYEEMPVPPDWHEAYAQEETDTEDYRCYVHVCT